MASPSSTTEKPTAESGSGAAESQTPVPEEPASQPPAEETGGGENQVVLPPEALA